MESEVKIPAAAATLEGILTLPQDAKALILFVHGSGSSRHSPRNQFVARTLNDFGLGTLLFDLLTREEEALDLQTRQYRFDIGLLVRRLVKALAWAKQHQPTRTLRFGLFHFQPG